MPSFPPPASAPRRAAAVLLLLASACMSAPPASADCVVLLHGLARTSTSMKVIAEALEAHGFRVANVDYPSRSATIEELTVPAIDAGVANCRARGDGAIHFVTHSMGGILVRVYLEAHELADLGRVVMLAPPNQGSEVVDALAAVPGFGLINGPAGNQLGTDAQSVPMRLGPVDFPLGIIAGTTSINPILSQFLTNPDDGKVSVERTKVEGMTDFATIKASHPLIMRDKAAVRLTVRFLETGSFTAAAE